MLLPHELAFENISIDGLIVAPVGAAEETAATRVQMFDRPFRPILHQGDFSSSALKPATKAVHARKHPLFCAA